MKRRRGRPPAEIDHANLVRLRIQGWSLTRLAARYGVSVPTVKARLERLAEEQETGDGRRRSNRESLRRSRAISARRGVCPRCRGDLDCGRSMCSRCLASNRASKARLRDFYRSAGVCRHCGGELETQTLCAEHARQLREAARARRARSASG